MDGGEVTACTTCGGSLVGAQKFCSECGTATLFAPARLEDLGLLGPDDRTSERAIGSIRDRYATSAVPLVDLDIGAGRGRDRGHGTEPRESTGPDVPDLAGVPGRAASAAAVDLDTDTLEPLDRPLDRPLNRPLDRPLDRPADRVEAADPSPRLDPGVEGGDPPWGPNGLVGADGASEELATRREHRQRVRSRWARRFVGVALVMFVVVPVATLLEPGELREIRRFDLAFAPGIEYQAGKGPASEPERRWELDLSVGGSVVSGAVFDELLVYVETDEGDDAVVHGVELETGDEKWEHDLDDEQAYVLPTGDDLVIVSTSFDTEDFDAETTVVGLDKRNGDERWSHDAEGFGAIPIGNVIALANEDRCCTVIERGTGKVLWDEDVGTLVGVSAIDLLVTDRRDLLRYGVRSGEKSETVVEDAFSSCSGDRFECRRQAHVAPDGQIVVLDDGEVIVLDEEGEPVWDDDDLAALNIYVFGDRVVASGPEEAAAFRVADGARISEWDGDADDWTSVVALFDDRAVAVTFRDVVLLDIESGERLGEFDREAGVDFGSNVLVNTDGEAVGVTDFRHAWEARFDRDTEFVVAIAQGWVITAGDGEIHAYH